jgi:hypothetical protein
VVGRSCALFMSTVYCSRMYQSDRYRFTSIFQSAEVEAISTNDEGLGGPMQSTMGPRISDPGSRGTNPCIREQKSCPSSAVQHCLGGCSIFSLSVENAAQPALSSQRFTFPTIKP